MGPKIPAGRSDTSKLKHRWGGLDEAAKVEDFRALAPQRGTLVKRASLQVPASDQKIGGLIEAALPKLHGSGI